MKFSIRDVIQHIARTGDLPDATWGEDFGGQEAFSELPFRTRVALWSGCIDAPSHMPAGSTRGTCLGYELLASPRSVPRDAPA